MSNKELYSQFCNEKADVPIFFQPWWLDIVTHDGSWKVSIDKTDDGKVRGIWPIFEKRKFNIAYNSMPPLTPYLGIYLNYPENITKEERKRAFEEKVVTNLIAMNAGSNYLNYNFHHRFSCWLPFEWNGYRNRIKITNIFEDLSDLDRIQMGFKDSLRNKISKADKLVSVSQTEDLETFYKVNEKTFSRQGLKIPYSYAFLKQLDVELASRGQRKILIAKDEKDNIHAAAYLIMDNRYYYLIALGGDSTLRKSGAIPLLIWKSMQEASKDRKGFDFEGSSISQVAGIFRNFGASQVNYFNIYRSKNKMTDALLTLLGKF